MVKANTSQGSEQCYRVIKMVLVVYESHAVTIRLASPGVRACACARVRACVFVCVCVYVAQGPTVDIKIVHVAWLPCAFCQDVSLQTRSKIRKIEYHEAAEHIKNIMSSFTCCMCVRACDCVCVCVCVCVYVCVKGQKRG